MTTFRGRARVNRTTLTVCAVLTACATGERTGPVATPADGNWRYLGTQESPVPATIEGTIRLVGTGGGGAFEGTLTALEVLPTGQSRPLGGPAAGRVVADTVFDFDVTSSGAVRRHLGVRRGDSVSGTWAVIGQMPAAGRFGMRRQ